MSQLPFIDRSADRGNERRREFRFGVEATRKRRSFESPAHAPVGQDLRPRIEASGESELQRQVLYHGRQPRPKNGRCRHREQGRAGLRVAASRRDPVPSKAGCCPERPREIGAGALRSRPLRLRLRRSRPAPTTRGTSGVGDEYFATCDGVNIMIAPVAIQTGWNRDPKIQQSDFERVVGRVWVCSRLSWIFGALFSVRSCVCGVGSARRESADLRASIPATLCDAPSRDRRWRCYLGLTPPQPRPSSNQRYLSAIWRPACGRHGACFVGRVVITNLS